MTEVKGTNLSHQLLPFQTAEMEDNEHFWIAYNQCRSSDRLPQQTQLISSLTAFWKLSHTFEWQHPLWNWNAWKLLPSTLPPSPPASQCHQQGLKAIPLSCCQSKLTWSTIFHNYLKLKQLVIKVILAPWWHIQHDKTVVMRQQQNLSALFTRCSSALFCWVTDLSVNNRRATKLN